MSDDVGAKRARVLETVEEIITHLEEISEVDSIGFIRSNVYNAEQDLLDSGEFNYHVRMALVQIQNYSGQVNDSRRLDEIKERARELAERLEDEAELPPPEEVERSR